MEENYNLETELNFIPDEPWQHNVAKDVMSFLKEKWSVSSSTFNKDYIFNLYDIVRIIKTNLNNDQQH